MKQILNYYLPDEEKHFTELMQLLGTVPQAPIRNRALHYTKKFDVSLDIGANLGLWSKIFEENFKKNYAIEPLSEHITYLRRNAPQTTIFQYAVSNVSKESTIKMIQEPFDGNCGMSKINEEGTVEVPCISLDLLYKNYELPPADLIKIDVEYHELEVLKGGEDYIKSSWPVLLIEHKKNSPVIEFLQSWGYYTGKSFKIKDDYIYLKKMDEL